MSSSPPIHFHVGAHKTATTYMQSRLRSNRNELTAEGIKFIDLWAKTREIKRFRRSLRQALERDIIDTNEVAALIEPLRKIVKADLSTDSQIVISFENILGDYDLTRGSIPYPNAAPAIRYLVDSFPDHKLRIFLSIRSLDRFVESGYLQQVSTRRETRSFRQYMTDIDLKRVSWIPMVNSIRSVIGEDNLFLWRYEEFVLDEEPFWDALLARQNAQAMLLRPARSTNHSLSVKGLKYMRHLNKIATPSDMRKFRPFVRRNFGSHAGYRVPTLLNEAMRERLKANYERDLEKLF